MRTWLGRGTFAAIVVFGAATAEAQITTVIETPKRTTVAAQQAAARREEVAQDSIARITMTGMKEWVDSAAASLAIRPDTGTVPASDTAAATRRSTQPAHAAERFCDSDVGPFAGHGDRVPRWGACA